VNSCGFLAQHFSNAGYAYAAEIQEHGLFSRVEIGID
jgi:hypothetical protein